MKGLFLAFGLIAALFVSNVHASIFDSASNMHPFTDSVSYYSCNRQNSPFWTDFSQCKIYNENNIRGLSPSINFDFVTCSLNGVSVDCIGRFTGVRADKSTYVVDYDWPKHGSWIFQYSDDSLMCPPKDYPLYSFPYDSDNNGKIDKCFNPTELDNNSKCADLFNSGSMLSAGTNVAPLVCKTFDDGSRCAYSRVEQGSTPYYQPNLEKGCFGDAEQIPDYDNDIPPSPQPDECKPYFGGFACAADPSKYCDANNSCVDGCGYVNSQFICFRDQECTGSDCIPAPVNCENTPDAPICKEDEVPPDTNYCQQNPTASICQSGSDFCQLNPASPSCQSSGNGSGAGKFTLDYDKLINGMKDAVKLIVDPNETPEFSDFKSEIDDKTSELDSDIDDFMNGSHFDGINEQISANPFAGQFQLPSGGGCSAFDLGGHSLDLCGAAQKVSSVLYFVFSFLTLLYLKNLFFSTVTPRKE